MNRFISPENLVQFKVTEKEDDIITDDFDIVDERIIFLEWIQRKLEGEVACDKIVYFGDYDLHRELDDELAYHTDLIKNWVRELQLSN